MNVYIFDEHKCKPIAEWKRDGKPERPDMVTMIIDRKRAIDLAITLLQSVRNSEPGEDRISVWFMGELTREP